MWEQLPNTEIDSDGRDDKKAHLSFYFLLGHLLRIIPQIRVLDLYLGKSWYKIAFRVASIQEETQAKKEGVITDFNAQISTS